MIETPLQRRAPLPPQLTRRVGVLGVLAFVLFGVIVFRLWYLQVLTGTDNLAKATANVVRDIPTPAPRGSILDSSGRTLATYRLATQAAIVKDLLPPAGPQRQALYRRLGAVLGLHWRDIRKTVDNIAIAPPGYAPTPIKDDIGSFAWTVLAERKREFPGVVEQSVPVRYYPNHGDGAVMLGEVGQITGGATGELGTARYKGVAAGAYVGQSGLEAAYQTYLQGTAGYQRVEVDSAGYPTGVQKTPIPPMPGDQLKTSIDGELEKEGYIALHQAEQAARTLHNPAPAGAFVAIDPSSGRVLALGSDPTYDANDFAKPLGTSTYTHIRDSGALNDLAIAGQYPTGSTFKPITALAGLGAGLITPQTTQGAGACITFVTTRLCNSGGANYGDKDLVDALTVSEDTYFYLVGNRAESGHSIQNEARALGLGSAPGIDLPGAATGVVPDRAYVDKLSSQLVASHCVHAGGGSVPVARYAHAQLWVTTCSQGYFAIWTVGQNILLGVGQGLLLATPLQMAVAYSAIANGGTVWTPQIGDQILSPSGALVQQLPAPTSRHISIDPGYRAVVMQGLHAAAQSPTGTSYAVFSDFPRPVYGKTGTAVHVGQKDQSWYVVYAPDAHRPIVVAVTIEQGGFGAAAAAPAARLMLSQWFGIHKKFISGSSKDH